VVVQREALRRQVIVAAQDGNARLAAVRAGNAVGLIHEIQAARDIVRQVVAEAEHILRERPGQVLQERTQ
jgi:NAD(P)H-dependent flavin oxidoreductase YrpB (nitropropane dioxygenase family)